MALVSVCIPTYNGAKYVGEAVHSVLAQTLTDFELIIVDDASTDETEAVIKSFSDSRLKFYKNSVRLGLVGNWNKCIELSSGQYICIFHQDDIMLPENLAEKIKILADNPTVGLVYSNVVQIGPQGEHLFDWWYFKPTPDQNGIQTGTKFFKDLLFGPNNVCCPSVVARRACYEQLGGFDARLPLTADLEMWLRLALFYDVAYLVKPLLHYRRHEANEALNYYGPKELEQTCQAKMLILDKYSERVQHVESFKSKITREHVQQALERAQSHYRRQQFVEARAYLAFAVTVQGLISKSASPEAYTDWFLEIIDQLWQQEPGAVPLEATGQVEQSQQPLKFQPIFRQVVDNLSGEDIAHNIPLRKLIKAVGFKIGARLGFRWLYRYRDMGKKLLKD